MQSPAPPMCCQIDPLAEKYSPMSLCSCAEVANARKNDLDYGHSPEAEGGEKALQFLLETLVEVCEQNVWYIEN